MNKYILDTDIGDDIDDAFALDLALKLGIDLVCVTTVFRNTVQRAAIAKKLLSLHGRDIPVYAGMGETLDGENEKFPLCQWTDDLTAYMPTNSSPEEAVDAILEAARTYGKDLRILAIGPLTNVALALRKDREAMLATGGIVMMGGDYVNHYSEWNIRCDLTAAKEVFDSGIKIVAFGHEVTSLAKLSEEEQDYAFSMHQDAAHAYLAELSRLWVKSKPPRWRIVLHDAMVVRFVAEPQFCKLQSARVAVETAGTYTYGMTVNLTKIETNVPAAHTIEYATDVDIREFLDYMMKKLGYQAKGGNIL